MVLNRRFFYALLACAALACGVRAAAEVPVSDYIRLHVVADSDAEDAQALKLRVRDAVLAETRTLLSGCPDADAAWAALNERLKQIEAAARDTAREAGYDGPVAAALGVFDFPDRVYGGVVVPAGEYRALRVAIGKGAGRNWWCVLYPSLCLPEGETPQSVEFYSVIWDWLRRWLGGGDA